jgi:hypothetical protein
MFLCRDLYGVLPPADLLLIQGESWELQQGLSPQAQSRLEAAVEFFSRGLAENTLFSHRARIEK